MTNPKTKIPAKMIGFLLMVSIGIFVAVASPFNELNPTGHLVLSFTLITVGSWIFQPWNMPYGVSGLFFLGSMIVIGLPMGTVFSGFTQNAVWTLIPALFFGLALQKTGLGKRIAMGIFGLFPASWFTVILAWVIIGMALSLVTPSSTVRVAIMLPIALQCCKLYSLEAGSKGVALLLLSALTMAVLPGCAWQTGGLIGPIVQGVFDTIPSIAGQITFSSWLQGALLPVIICTVLTVGIGYFMLMPKEPLPKAAINPGEMGAVTSKEIKAAVVLTISCILFFTSSIHNIPTTAICLLALAVLYALNVLCIQDLTAGINWDLVLFIGCGLCMSQIFLYSGVSEWLSYLLTPLFMSLSVNPVVFVMSIFMGLVVWRFVDVTTLFPTMVILAPVVAKVFAECGVSPMVWAVLFIFGMCTSLLTYTNMWALMGRQMAGDFAWKEAQIFRYNIAYIISCIIALLCAVPYWSLLGLL